MAPFPLHLSVFPVRGWTVFLPPSQTTILNYWCLWLFTWFDTSSLFYFHLCSLGLIVPISTKLMRQNELKFTLWAYWKQEVWSHLDRAVMHVIWNSKFQCTILNQLWGLCIFHFLYKYKLDISCLKKKKLFTIQFKSGQCSTYQPPWC